MGCDITQPMPQPKKHLHPLSTEIPLSLISVNQCQVNLHCILAFMWGNPDRLINPVNSEGM
jgi:hypothetical protein